LDLTFITASAGSGKTHRLTDIVGEALASGQVPPSGLIATTFTNAAANELQERIRETLYKADRPDLAEQMGAGMIGTVHGVCRAIVQRFAFEAGIAPDVQVLDVETTSFLLDQAIASSVDMEEELRLNQLGDVLSESDWQSGGYRWRKLVGQIIENARTNQIPASEVAELGKKNADDMIAVWMAGAPTQDENAGRKMDIAFRQAVEDAIKAIEGGVGTTRITKEIYLAKLSEAMNTFRRGMGNVPWKLWASLAVAEAGKRDGGDELAADVRAAAEGHRLHPRLHENVRDYLDGIFRLAAQAMDAFTGLKEKRGGVDYADLEVRCLDLLRTNSTVRDILSEEIGLLVVDEFQDTSPLQLALFRQLAELAGTAYWVGDVKQAIYGFRGTDPQLTTAVLESDAISQRESLPKSWRSIPDLVEFANDLFEQPFATQMGLSAEKVRLVAHRQKDPEQDQPAVEFAGLASDNQTKEGRPKKLHAPGETHKKPRALARLVADILARGIKVTDKSSVDGENNVGRLRPLRHGDIGILVRSNKQATAISEALAEWGIEVAVKDAGLLATPECVLAMAALRRMVDHGDTLATAEIVALTHPEEQGEDWLLDRLDHLRDHPDDAKLGRAWRVDDPRSPEIARLNAALDDKLRLSVLGLFDRAVDLCDVYQHVAGWGPTARRAAQRRANLERLRGVISSCQDRCRDEGLPATLASLFLHLENLGEAGEDTVLIDPQTDAIHIGTYHRAKGLEWPMVLNYGLDDPGRLGLFGLYADFADGHQLNFDDPLANRTLRCWISPLDPMTSGGELIDALLDSDYGKRREQIGQAEELRMLYVALTRARDFNVLPFDKAVALPDPAFSWIHRTTGIDPRNAVASKRDSITEFSKAEPADSEATVPWFAKVAEQDQPTRLPGLVRPASAPAIPEAVTISSNDLGTGRLDIGHANVRDLGDALHRFYATDILHPGRTTETRLEIASEILAHWDLLKSVSAETAVLTSDRYLGWLSRIFPGSASAVEVPFTYHNEAGQTLTGIIDHLVTLPDGEQVILDHKAYPGTDPETNLPPKHSGQLAAYRGAILSAGKPLRRTFLHLPVLGKVLEVSLEGSSSAVT